MKKLIIAAMVLFVSVAWAEDSVESKLLKDSAEIITLYETLSGEFYDYNLYSPSYSIGNDVTIVATDTVEILYNQANPIDLNGSVSPDELDPSRIANKEEVIKYFIESGDVCKVIGHVWEVYDPCYNPCGDCMCPNEFNVPDLNVWYGQRCTKTRTCEICGLKQKETSKTEKVEVEVEREVKEWIDAD